MYWHFLCNVLAYQVKLVEKISPTTIKVQWYWIKTLTNCCQKQKKRKKSVFSTWPVWASVPRPPITRRKVASSGYVVSPLHVPPAHRYVARNVFWGIVVWIREHGRPRCGPSGRLRHCSRSSLRAGCVCMLLKSFSCTHTGGLSHICFACSYLLPFSWKSSSQYTYSTSSDHSAIGWTPINEASPAESCWAPAHWVSQYCRFHSLAWWTY